MFLMPTHLSSSCILFLHLFLPSRAQSLSLSFSFSLVDSMFLLSEWLFFFFCSFFLLCFLACILYFSSRFSFLSSAFYALFPSVYFITHHTLCMSMEWIQYNTTTTDSTTTTNVITAVTQTITRLSLHLFFVYFRRHLPMPLHFFYCFLFYLSLSVSSFYTCLISYFLFLCFYTFSATSSFLPHLSLALSLCIF